MGKNRLKEPIPHTNFTREGLIISLLNEKPHLDKERLNGLSIEDLLRFTRSDVDAEKLVEDLRKFCKDGQRGQGGEMFPHRRKAPYAQQ